MKNDVMPSIVQMEYGELETLLTEVKETLAIDIKMPERERQNPSFGIGNLWKIRRNAKSARSMFKG